MWTPRPTAHTVMEYQPNTGTEQDKAALGHVERSRVAAEQDVQRLIEAVAAQQGRRPVAKQYTREAIEAELSSLEAEARRVADAIEAKRGILGQLTCWEGEATRLRADLQRARQLASAAAAAAAETAESSAAATAAAAAKLSRAHESGNGGTSTVPNNQRGPSPASTDDVPHAALSASCHGVAVSADTMRHLNARGATVEARQGRGRCVVAARPLPCGAIVMRCAASAAALLPQHWDRRCACCLSKPATGSKLLRCSRCSAVSYCSKECQVLDWLSHKRECRVAKGGAIRRLVEQGSTPAVTDVLLLGRCAHTELQGKAVYTTNGGVAEAVLAQSAEDVRMMQWHEHAPDSAAVSAAQQVILHCRALGLLPRRAQTDDGAKEHPQSASSSSSSSAESTLVRE